MEIKFATDGPTLVNNLIIVDGLTRSGKFFLGKIISGLNNIDFLQYSYILDYLPYMATLNAISTDGAISLLRSVVDQSCYDQSIGRNLNLRFDDRSSIYNSPDFDRYILRSKSEFSRERIVKYLSDKDQHFLFVLHNNLASANIMFKAFPDIKIVHLLRNPVDLVYSWMMKDYLKIEINNRPDYFFKIISVDPAICGNNGPLPWFVYPIKNDYESLNQTDRIIACINSIITLSKDAFSSLSCDYRKQIIFPKYEHLVENTNEVIDDISEFLGTHRSTFMNEIIVKENCPNVINVEERTKKRNKIFNQATSKYYEILETLENKYAENSNFNSD